MGSKESRLEWEVRQEQRKFDVPSTRVGTIGTFSSLVGGALKSLSESSVCSFFIFFHCLAESLSLWMVSLHMRKNDAPSSTGSRWWTAWNLVPSPWMCYPKPTQYKNQACWYNHRMWWYTHRQQFSLLMNLRNTSTTLQGLEQIIICIWSSCLWCRFRSAPWFLSSATAQPPIASPSMARPWVPRGSPGCTWSCGRSQSAHPSHRSLAHGRFLRWGLHCMIQILVNLIVFDKGTPMV